MSDIVKFFSHVFNCIICGRPNSLRTIMLFVKALHLIFMVTWFAAIFYLPRLYVYHSMSTDEVSIERFKIMERKLYYGIATPGAILTLVFGFWTLSYYPVELIKSSGWIHAKLSLVFALVIYHLYCGRLLKVFKLDKNKHGHKFYRIINEIPVLFLVGIVFLAVLKPF